jgi:hypothetical protein
MFDILQMAMNVTETLLTAYAIPLMYSASAGYTTSHLQATPLHICRLHHLTSPGYTTSHLQATPLHIPEDSNVFVVLYTSKGWWLL